MQPNEIMDCGDCKGSELINDEVIFSRVGDLMTKLYQNKNLQQLAEKNGLNVKNSVNLTDDAIEAISTATVALLLAKMSGDARYAQLREAGLKHRSLKTEIVNDYKAAANQLIGRYNYQIKKDMEAANVGEGVQESADVYTEGRYRSPFWGFLGAMLLGPLGGVLTALTASVVNVVKGTDNLYQDIRESLIIIKDMGEAKTANKKSGKNLRVILNTVRKECEDCELNTKLSQKVRTTIIDQKAVTKAFYKAYGDADLDINKCKTHVEAYIKQCEKTIEAIKCS